MIQFTITGEEAALARLKELEPQLRTALIRKIDLLNTKLQARIQGMKLSGQVLQHRSGKLKRSIELVAATANGGIITGGVQGGGGPAYYGRFHEFGTKAYTIVPVSKKALSFLIGGRRVFAKSVRHPGLPERSFMRSAQREMEDEFIQGLQETVNRVLSAGGGVA